MITSWRALLVFIAVTPAACGQTSTASQPGPQATRFDYRVEPVVDLYNYVREQATRSGASDAPREFDTAISRAKAIRKKLGTNVLLWAGIDEYLIGCKTATDCSRALERMPERVKIMGNDSPAIRREALALGEALIAVESVHRETLWPKHQTAIRRALDAIEKEFRAKEAACISYMLRSLGMEDPHDTVPVYLVQRISWPGAYTIRRPDGGGACFVAVGEENHAGTLLFETILHEATHAMDLLVGDRNSVLLQMRLKLGAAGLGPRDRELRDIPHTIMFIQAGETVRRIVNPAHKHYGDVAGYYARLSRVADVERPAWVDYLDGKLSREAAVEKIIAGVTHIPQSQPH